MESEYAESLSLSEQLINSDGAVREAAVVVIGLSEPELAQAYSGQLANLVQSDPDSGVKEAAAEALGRLRPCVADAKALLVALSDEDGDVRAAAAKAAARIEEAGLWTENGGGRYAPRDVVDVAAEVLHDDTHQ